MVSPDFGAGVSTSMSACTSGRGVELGATAEQGVELFVRQVHEVDTGVSHVFAIQEFAFGRACAPDGDGGGVVRLGFVELADEGGDDVAVFPVTIRLSVIIRHGRRCTDSAPARR